MQDREKQHRCRERMPSYIVCSPFASLLLRAFRPRLVPRGAFSYQDVVLQLHATETASGGLSGCVRPKEQVDPPEAPTTDVGGPGVLADPGPFLWLK